MDDCVSGRKSVSQVAAAHEVSEGQVYKWKVQLDEKAKGAKTDELEASGTRPEDAKLIHELKA